MKLKLRSAGRALAALTASATMLIAYTNCTPTSGAESSASSSSPSASNTFNMVANKITASGGLSNNLFAGCQVGTFSDWIETRNSEARRILPRDCTNLNVSTPVFSWPQPRDLMAGTGYTLHVFGTTNLYDNSLFPNVPRALMNKAMPPGNYKWTVTYKNSSGVVVTSAARQFAIPSGTLFAIPSGAQMANSILAKSHPRIQPNENFNPANGKVPWSTIMSRDQSRGYQASFNYYFYTQLNNSMNYSLPAVPTTRNKMIEMRWAINNLAYGYRFFNDPKYFTKAVTLLQGLVTWPTLAATTDDAQDQVNREIHSALAFCLDMFQDKLAESAYQPLRSQMVSALTTRLNWVDFSSFNTYPYDSHLLTNAIYSVESVMYAAGTPGFDSGDGGRQRLASLWENAVTTIGIWGGSLDGGFADSGGYGWYETDGYARFMANTRLMANIDVSPWPALGRIGYNQLYFSPPAPNAREQFGDEAEVTGKFATYANDTFRLIAMVTGKPEYEWYWRLAGDAAANDKFMWNPVHYMYVAAPTNQQTFPAFNASSLSRSILFEDAGQVAMHSDMGNPNRTSVFFRSSPFAAFNHNHADQNAFTFVSKGKDMFISAGIYDYYGSPFHMNITRATRFKNALTMDGGLGQAEPNQYPVSNQPGAPIIGNLDFSGKIVNFQDDGNWVVATGDAKNAYRAETLSVGILNPLLSNYYRTVAYNRTLGLVLIYDWAHSSTPRHWELNFHTLQSNNPTMFGAGQNFKLSNATTSACMRVWTQDQNYYYDTSTNWEGRVPETSKTIDPEYHIRFNNRNTSQEFTAVTVISEGCASIPVNISITDSTAYVNVNGSTLTFDGAYVNIP